MSDLFSLKALITTSLLLQRPFSIDINYNYEIYLVHLIFYCCWATPASIDSSHKDSQSLNSHVISGITSFIEFSNVLIACFLLISTRKRKYNCMWQITANWILMKSSLVDKTKMRYFTNFRPKKFIFATCEGYNSVKAS